MDSLQKEDIVKLAHRIKASDEQAFAKLFHLAYPRLVKFSWRYTRTKTPAEDIVQESFVKLWKKRDNIDPEQSLMAYIFQIVRNRSLNYLRDRGVENTALDDLPGYMLRSDQPDETTSEGSLIQNELGRKMLGWIDQLPDRQREAIRLSRFEGLDHEEIAYVMEISPRTVNNHIVAGLKTLRTSWNNYKENTNNGLYYDSKE